MVFVSFHLFVVLFGAIFMTNITDTISAIGYSLRSRSRRIDASTLFQALLRIVSAADRSITGKAVSTTFVAIYNHILSVYPARRGQPKFVLYLHVGV
jgi:hypothetical protein